MKTDQCLEGERAKLAARILVACRGREEDEAAMLRSQIGNLGSLLRRNGLERTMRFLLDQRESGVSRNAIRANLASRFADSVLQLSRAKSEEEASSGAVRRRAHLEALQLTSWMKRFLKLPSEVLEEDQTDGESGSGGAGSDSRLFGNSWSEDPSRQPSSLGLFLDKARLQRGSGSWKSQFLEQRPPPVPRRRYQDWHARFSLACSKLGYTLAEDVATRTRLVVGWGSNPSLETGLSLHPLLSFPVIPASSLRGAFKRAAEECVLGGFESGSLGLEQAIDHTRSVFLLFGSLPTSGAHDPGYSTRLSAWLRGIVKDQGGVDALALDREDLAAWLRWFLEKSTGTDQQSELRQFGCLALADAVPAVVAVDRPLDVDILAPQDSGSLIPFLAVPTGYRFEIRWRIRIPGRHPGFAGVQAVDQVGHLEGHLRIWTAMALGALGVGAKTASGFGRFEKEPFPSVDHPAAPLRYEFLFETPVVLRGADPASLEDPVTARGTSVRGQLRFWTRALEGRPGIPLEDELWGSTEGGQRCWLQVWMKDREEESRATREPKVVMGFPLFPKKSVRDLEGFVQGDRKLVDQKANALRSHFRGGAVATDVIAPGAAMGLEVGFPAGFPEEARLGAHQILKAWSLLGGLGRRWRRGYGSARLWYGPEGPPPDVPSAGALASYLGTMLGELLSQHRREGSDGFRLQSMDQIFVGKPFAVDVHSLGFLKWADHTHGLNEMGRGPGLRTEADQLGRPKSAPASRMVWTWHQIGSEDLAKVVLVPVMTWSPTLDCPIVLGSPGMRNYVRDKLGFEVSLTGNPLFS